MQEKEGFKINGYGWIATIMVATAIIVVLYHCVNVVYFEQSDAGSYAIHRECEIQDNDCLSSCDDSTTGRGISCSSCCMSWREVRVPIGDRLKDLLPRGIITGLFFGFWLGLFTFELVERKGWIK